MSLDKVQKRADTVLAEAEDWLRQNGGRRFFSWIHLYDPHTPYDAPSPFREQYRAHPYRGEVAYLDSELGKFFAFLKDSKLWDKTIIVVVGDHGESFGEHREQGHGFFIYDSTVRVPLIIRVPRPLPGQTRRTDRRAGRHRADHPRHAGHFPARPGPGPIAAQSDARPSRNGIRLPPIAKPTTRASISAGRS